VVNVFDSILLADPLNFPFYSLVGYSSPRQVTSLLFDRIDGRDLETCELGSETRDSRKKISRTAVESEELKGGNDGRDVLEDIGSFDCAGDVLTDSSFVGGVDREGIEFCSFGEDVDQVFDVYICFVFEHHFAELLPHDGEGFDATKEGRTFHDEHSREIGFRKW